MRVFHFSVVSLFIGVALFGFQNCSKTTFSSPQNSSSTNSQLSTEIDPNDPGYEIIVQIAELQSKVVFDKADVLFVLDESVSMNNIAAEVQAGFASIPESVYPTDTLMAVTNMAPAKYVDPSTDQFDISQSFFNLAQIVDLPGFIRLINKASVDHYVATHGSPNYPKPACAQSWFKPQDKNSNGDYCLVAHSQISQERIGVEAGLIALDQLVKTHFGNSSRLFRKGALANVIFVSDTHDPGKADYYGQPGGASDLPSYTKLIQTVHSLNDDLAGLKFHGVVPLPPAGSPELDGVTTVGTIPATIEESKVANEYLYGFSYLPYIKNSGGIAIHPVGNSWTSAIEQMVHEISTVQSPVLIAPYPVSEVIYLKVNGQLLSPSEFTVHSDQVTIEIHANNTWGDTINVEFKFKRSLKTN